MSAQGGKLELVAWLDNAISKANEEADRWHDSECDFHLSTLTDTTVLGGGATLCDCQGPVSMRRRCAADRKLLRLHTPVTLRAGGGARYFEAKWVCTSCEPPRQFPEEAVPCATLRTLAEGYGWTNPTGSRPDPGAQTSPIEGDQMT